MDALKFSEMLSDKHITNLKKLKYKYPDDFEEFINILKSSFYEKLPLNDFDGKNLVYLTSCTGVNLEAVKLLLPRRTPPMPQMRLKRRSLRPRRSKALTSTAAACAV